VNEIGNYSGEVVLGAGPELIQIQSDGHWTLRTTGCTRVAQLTLPHGKQGVWP
jgi:hypothetical protein